MATSTNVNVRMDSDLRQDFERFCGEVGMSISTAMNIFARKAVREQRIPFEISAGNIETTKAIDDAKTGRDLHGPFDTVDELMKDLNA